MSDKKTVVITGANRGIGLEFVKQLSAQGMEVIATCRQPDDATELHALKKIYHHISILPLDVTSDDDIDALMRYIENKPIDWLINNAGISGETGVKVGHISRDNFMHVMNVNCLSVLKLSDALLPQIKQSVDKLIICISSRMGSIADNDSGARYAYRCSKAALNCAMRSFALDVKPFDVNVMLMHPGWVETDLGGENALITPEQSVSGMLEVIANHGHESHAETLLRYDGDTIAW